VPSDRQASTLRNVSELHELGNPPPVGTESGLADNDAAETVAFAIAACPWIDDATSGLANASEPGCRKLVEFNCHILREVLRVGRRRASGGEKVKINPVPD
jgi:hypothetical protein